MTILQLGSETEVAPLDSILVSALASRVSEALADERIFRRTNGNADLLVGQEWDFARSAAQAECARLGTSRRQEGRIPFSDSQERQLANAAIAQVLGLGRLQSLLDDQEISDIHVRGCAPVWVKLRNGTRQKVAPVVDTDDELIELIRRAATRMGRTERRFDAATPELNLQLPDGSRLFATMEVSARPSLVIRRHRFEISSLNQLRLRGLFDETLQDF